MVRKSVVAGALGVAFALLCAGPVLALSVTVADDGGNTVSVDSVVPDSGNWDVGVTEDYVNTNSVWLELQQQPGQGYGGDVRFEKSITNSTNLLWRDFHMKLWVPNDFGGWIPSPNDDNLYFTDVGLTGPFSEVWFEPSDIDELWLWDGVWNPSETYTLSFSVGGSGWRNGNVPHFRIEEWPTDTGGPDGDVPEPATLLLTLAGVAGLALRRRRSA